MIPVRLTLAAAASFPCREIEHPPDRSKTEAAQVNEVLCKLLCHNLCCLVHATYELGIGATFWKAAA
jgi:hypothetical protein